MWNADWRDRIWASLDEPWDVLVIGGGIVGAGIMREGSRAGLRVLLVEQHDFGSGSSSRSSKLIHGGFRYLVQGKLRIVRDGVQQRQRLIAEGDGLVTPLPFMLASYRGDSPAPWVYQLLLVVYDLLAGQWNHQRYDPRTFASLAPHIAPTDLVAGLRNVEATTDDARLVLRVIDEAVAAGGTAISYTQASALLRDGERVTGVRLHDLIGERSATVRARVVVNATGAWADRLRDERTTFRLRPLRGSHLVFPGWRIPLAQVIAVRHPLDNRFVNVTPWEGMTVVGTTDLDHDAPLDAEPTISAEEVAYLMAAADSLFPSLGLRLEDVIATFSGVRPVVDGGEHDPSRESREHLILDEAGLITAMGGKLTTFQLVAWDIFDIVREHLGGLPRSDRTRAVFDPSPDRLDRSLPAATRTRLLGRYGARAAALVAAAQPDELEPILGTPVMWAELRWGARAEGVVHLDDLLLRRVRLGLLLPNGGAAELPRIRAICQGELGWDDQHWQDEQERYLRLWQTHYSVPDAATIPDWPMRLADARERRAIRRAARRRTVTRRDVPMALALAALGLVGLGFWRGRGRGDVA